MVLPGRGPSPVPPCPHVFKWHFFLAGASLALATHPSRARQETNTKTVYISLSALEQAMALKPQGQTAEGESMRVSTAIVTFVSCLQ